MESSFQPMSMSNGCVFRMTAFLGDRIVGFDDA
jgi:hypothetical protein